VYYEELTVETFHELISPADDTAVFVMFYSPECPHCRAWAPTWYELAAKLHGDNDVRIARVGSDNENIINLSIDHNTLSIAYLQLRVT